MHPYLREALSLIISFLIFATAADLITIYFFGLGDPKFSPWGNIQFRFWGNLLSMIVLAFEGLIVLSLLKPAQLLLIWKIPASAIAALSIVIYTVIYVEAIWALKIAPGLIVRGTIGLGGPFILLLLIFWLAKRSVQ